MLQQGLAFDALFAASDLMAMTAISALEAGTHARIIGRFEHGLVQRRHHFYRWGKWLRNWHG